MGFAATRIGLFLAAALVFAFSAPAQQKADSPPDSTDFQVEGTVVDADTGKPIENAYLRLGPRQLCCGTPAAVATSDADGAFKASTKGTGPYSFIATHEGYVADWPRYPTCLGSNPGDCVILRNCSPCKVTVPMHAQSKLSGRVVAADAKNPISLVLVEAIRVSNDAFDVATSLTIASSLTDRNGEFTMTQLTPGQYFFRFTPVSAAASLLVADADDPPARQFVRQWWPGGDSYRNATPFTVQPGTAFRLPDVWLSPIARFQVSGTIVASACQPEDSYTVSIGQDRDTASTGTSVEPFSSMIIRCGAKFAFPDLAPGRYQISLLAKDRPEAGERSEVIVTDRNLQRDLTPVRPAQ